MARVIVIGGGIAGLGSALALARQDHDVTIVERDSSSLPPTADEAFTHWSRRGAPQVRHSHAFLARLRNLLRDREPELLRDLLAAGATELRFTDEPPPDLRPLAPEPGDEDLVALACRRTTFEWVLRRDAIERRGVSIIEGAVKALVADAAPRTPGVPHVAGVRLEDESLLAGDIVIDASGRRSPLPAWLEEIGCGPVAEDVEDTGMLYSSRFYRLLPDAEPPITEGPVAADLGYAKFAVFVGDNRTFSVTFGIPAADRDLRALLKPGPFTAAASALPVVRPWLEAGRSEPITGVEVMAGLLNRRRHMIRDGRPVVTGLFAVGDSNICTNPLYGRGCSLAMVQAYALADVLNTGADAVQSAVDFADATSREIEPWYLASVEQDRADESARSIMRDGVMAAAGTDPVVYRAFLRAFNLLVAPGALMADADVVARVLSAWQDRESRPAPAPSGPDLDGMRAILDRAVHS